MANIETIVTLVLLFAVLVFFHELGHFLAAKFFKMPVEEFALGFGPRLIRLFHDGETDYNLRAVPLGGFVKISGMDFGDDESDVKSGDPEKVVAPGTGFNDRPLFQRFVVIFAGPLFSFVLGWLAFLAFSGIYGVPTGQAKIGGIEANMPAQRAGLRTGDIVVKIDETTVTSSGEVTRTINDSPGKPLTFLVRGTDNAERTVSVTPDATGTGEKKIGRIGVKVDASRRPGSFGELVAAANRDTGDYFAALGKIFTSGKVKDSVSGPIGIVQTVRQTVDYGFFAKLLLLAQLSLSLAVFNMFPIPVLDGGHILMIFYQAIVKRNLTPTEHQRFMMAGLVILGLLICFVMFNDIARLIGR